MILKPLVTAFQFLTIIPIKTKWDLSEKEICNSSIFFPLVGAFQGIVLVLVSFICLKVFSLEITAAIILVAYLFMTGGFHQDGLSDTFDAFAVKSSGNLARDREKRLQVMKDSTTGPIGVVAIVFTILLKYLLIKESLSFNAGPGKYLILFFLPIFSKWAMVSVMYGAKKAREEGLGRIFLDHTGIAQLSIATFLLLFVGFAGYFAIHSPLFSFPPIQGYCFISYFLATIVLVWSVCLFLKHVFTARFGGLTGDSFGAIHEISEIVFLLFVNLWR
jgi:adenosylcobinamide-GDP ribazoletransferase